METKFGPLLSPESCRECGFFSESCVLTFDDETVWSMFVEFASFISPLVQLSKLLLLLLVRISLCFCKATLPLGRVDHWMLGWGAGIFLSGGNFWSFEIGAPADEGASLLSSLVSEAWELEGRQKKLLYQYLH